MEKQMRCIPNQYEIKELPVVLGKNLKFLNKWAELSEGEFEMVMHRLAKERPEKFADIYLKVAQTIAPKVSATNQRIDVRHSIDTDMAKIRSLAGMKLNPSEQIEAPGRQTEYTEYEEVSKSAEK